MRLRLLVCLFFISFSLYAQKDFLETNSKLNDLIINKVSNEIIYVNDTHVYYADFNTLKVKDSIKIVSTPNTYIDELQFFKATNPLLIIKTKSKNKYYTEFYEYPEDSIYFYNINLKSIVNKFPGNLYATFNEKNPNQSVVAYNRYNTYTNSRTGEIVNGSKKGGLQTYPEKNEVESNGIVRNLKMNSKGTEVAIIYYNSIGENSDYHYTLELRSLPNLEVRNTKSIIGKITSIHFSEEDKYLVLKKDYNNTGSTSLSVNEDVDIYESSTLKKLTKIPNDLFLESLVENGGIWKKVKSEIINETYGTNEIRHKIWSNLTPFSAIDGFIKINKDELLIYGSKGYGFSGEKNGIYKYSLSNNAIFSKSSKVVEIDTLFQKNEVIISNNKVSGVHPQLNKNKNLLLLHNENKMQIWSTLDKRKLYDLEFDNAINPFLNPSGSSSLIFQSYEGKSFNEFKMMSLDLKTGIATTKLFTESNFNALLSKCFNIDKNKGSWLCSDGTDHLWKINTKNKTIESLDDYSNPNYYRTDIEIFKKIPETNKALISLKSVNVAPNHSVIDSKFEGFKIYDSDKNILTDISSLKENNDVFPVSSDELIYQGGNNLELFDLKNETSRKLQSFSGYKISKVIKHNNISNIILESSEKLVDSLFVLEYNSQTSKISNSFKIPYSKGHFLNNDGLHYKISERYYTYSSALDEKVVWENPGSLFTQSTDLSLTLDGKMLFRNEWLFNLKTLELEAQIPGFYNSIVLKNNQLFYIDSQQYDAKTPFFQFKIGEQNNLETVHWESETFPMKPYDGPNITQYSTNKKFILAYKANAYDGQTLYLINLQNKIVKTKKIKYNLNTVSFSDDENSLVLLKETNDFPSKKMSQIFETSTFKLVSEIEANYSNHINSNTILHTNGEYLVKSIVKGNLVTEDKSYFARKRLSIGKYLASRSLLVAGSDEGELLFWDPDNQSPIKTIKVSNSEILKIEEVNNSLFILSKDSEISIVGLDSLKLEVTCSFFEKEETVSVAWFTPDGYFKASKNDIRNFHFVKDGKTFPLLDYSLFLNRPDVLMQKVGFTSKSVYSLYKEAYLKRLRRNNYFENTDFLNINRPTVILNNRIDITSITNKKSLLLEIQNISNADELMIYINGVPVHEEKISGITLISKSIILNNGMNRVSIITKTEAGIESDPITFETKNVMPRSKSKVHYVGIGVSKYQDSSMNLKYADKDVRRLVDVFSSKYEGRIEIDTLLNQNVTKANIQALKKKLKQTSIDDTVIISFSGHGLIGDDNTFYFGVHDIDFNNPEANGVNYQEIQDLLTNIPARRKLLLLDACHSGELDVNESIETNSSIDKKVTQNIPEGAKGSKAKSANGNNNDTFQLMQSLFYDLNRGNGSYVISAAAGSEFAYEDDKWKNGVFTYSFINAIYDLGDDTWQGESGIPISKIKKYVYDNVKKLTDNKQQPTSRAENLEWDWVLE